MRHRDEFAVVQLAAHRFAAIQSGGSKIRYSVWLIPLSHKKRTDVDMNEQEYTVACQSLLRLAKEMEGSPRTMML
jgi:hypothetical protein